jgi:hypothetical protein
MNKVPYVIAEFILASCCVFLLVLCWIAGFSLVTEIFLSVICLVGGLFLISLGMEIIKR